MSIDYATAPEEVLAEARSGLRRTQGLKTTAGGLAPGSLETPHEVFTMDRSDLRQGKRLNQAKAGGWRYFVSAPQALAADAVSIPPVSVIEVGGQQGTYRFSHRQEGWIGDETQKAIAAAGKLPQVIAGDTACECSGCRGSLVPMRFGSKIKKAISIW
jgi:hypothetical protein